MAREYALDTEAAKKANMGGKRITDAGAYVGNFRAAFYEKNEKGTESVSFLFDSDNGQEAGPLTLYTHNKDGDALPGYDALNAIMTCMKVKSLKAKRGEVELYDFNASSMVTKTKELYPELSGKPVGLFLRREEYTKQSGDTGERLIINGSFEPTTKLMAGEILAKKTEAKSYDSVLSWLEKNPVKHQKGQRQQSSSQSYGSSAGGDFSDDDIPF